MTFQELLKPTEQLFNKMSNNRVKNLISKAIIKESYELPNKQGTYKFIQANFKGEIVNFFVVQPTEQQTKKTQELWSFYASNKV